jgi:hypothetical protein
VFCQRRTPTSGKHEPLTRRTKYHGRTEDAEARAEGRRYRRSGRPRAGDAAGRGDRGQRAQDGRGRAAAKKAAEEAEKESERERKAKEKAEAEQKVRQEKIDAGDLVVSSKQKYEFEAATKETKVFNQVQEIIAKYEDSDEPLVFGEVVKGISAKYPEDLIPAMHALEHLGIVRRFDAKSTSDGAGNRRQTAYLWIGLSDEDDADGAGSEDAGEVQAEQPAAA